MNNDEIYDPFAGAVVYDRTMIPEVIERIIPIAFGDEDEFYIYKWCDFVRDFGMEDSLEDIESKTVVKPVKRTTYDEYEEEYRDNLYGLEDLEDYGAFSDEGIMPGCHSDYNYCEVGNVKEYLRDYQENENMKKFFGGVMAFARESLGLSVECLAEETSLPKYIIENIEAGKEGIKSEGMASVTPLCMTGVAGVTDVPKRKRLWWEDKGDNEIQEVVKNYLIKRKNDAIRELLESISEKVFDYREGEVERITTHHVDKWIKQFEEKDQMSILRELDHILNKYYITKKKLKNI